MQMHELQKPDQKTKKRIGRGGKRGTYSGRGVKGQKSRAGARIRPEFRAYLKRIPKLRGADFQSKAGDFVVVQLHAVEKNFADGDIVSPKTLCDKKLISRTKGRFPDVKILGKAPITKAFIISQCSVSAGVRALIEKAGGTVR